MVATSCYYLLQKYFYWRNYGLEKPNYLLSWRQNHSEVCLSFPQPLRVLKYSPFLDYQEFIRQCFLFVFFKEILSTFLILWKVIEQSCCCFFFCFRVPWLSLWNENLIRTQINMRTCCSVALINYFITKKMLAWRCNLGSCFFMRKGGLWEQASPWLLISSKEGGSLKKTHHSL